MNSTPEVSNESLPAALPVRMPSLPTTRSRALSGWRTGLSTAWARAPRFIRNVAVSFPTFLFDLGLLWLLVRRAHIDYLVATIVAFLIANGISYFLARRLVFGETRRGVGVGLIYFLIVAAAGVGALTPMMWLFVTVFHIEIIVSRIASASIVGVGGYLVNLILNFRVGGRARAAGDRASKPFSG